MLAHVFPLAVAEANVGSNKDALHPIQRTTHRMLLVARRAVVLSTARLLLILETCCTGEGLPSTTSAEANS